jgi:uncharacterized protein YndB with AHSA1/START domain
MARAGYVTRFRRLWLTPQCEALPTPPEICMSSVKRIQFTSAINAPAVVVWQHITSLESYKRWASAFAEGCYFQGSWDAGSRILFLSPNGDGMISEIAESRTNEFVSIRHIGFLSNGTADTTSESVLSWMPAYENYTLVPVDGGTRMVVDLDVTTDFEEDMNLTWPKALDLLKGLCESASPG